MSFFAVRIQRRNKENLEQSAMDSGAIQSTENPEDDLVVDGLDPEKEAKNNDRDYFLPGGQLVGLDHAIVQSIERCRECQNNAMSGLRNH